MNLTSYAKNGSGGIAIFQMHQPHAKEACSTMLECFFFSALKGKYRKLSEKRKALCSRGWRAMHAQISPSQHVCWLIQTWQQWRHRGRKHVCLLLGDKFGHFFI